MKYETKLIQDKGKTFTLTATPTDAEAIAVFQKAHAYFKRQLIMNIWKQGPTAYFVDTALIEQTGNPEVDLYNAKQYAAIMLAKKRRDTKNECQIIRHTVLEWGINEVAIIRLGMDLDKGEIPQVHHWVDGPKK